MSPIFPKCAYRDGTICRVAAGIYQAPLPVSPPACEVCQAATEPMTINPVTISLAISGAASRKDSIAVSQLISQHGKILSSENSIRLAAILEGNGVGSQLWKLLESIGVKHTADCACLIWAELMNSWGPVKCREARPEIVEHMKASAKSYGWATYVYASVKVVVLRLMFKISVTDPYGSLLDEAIRRTEIAEEPKCASTKTC